MSFRLGWRKQDLVFKKKAKEKNKPVNFKQAYLFKKRYTAKEDVQGQPGPNQIELTDLVSNTDKQK